MLRCHHNVSTGQSGKAKATPNAAHRSPPSQIIDWKGMGCHTMGWYESEALDTIPLGVCYGLAPEIRWNGVCYVMGRYHCGLSWMARSRRGSARLAASLPRAPL